MSIEVGKIDTIQDGIPNNEKGNEFTNSEKNLIKDFYKSNKYKDVDESTLEEVKKTW